MTFTLNISGHVPPENQDAAAIEQSVVDDARALVDKLAAAGGLVDQAVFTGATQTADVTPLPPVPVPPPVDPQIVAVATDLRAQADTLEKLDATLGADVAELRKMADELDPPVDAVVVDEPAPAPAPEPAIEPPVADAPAPETPGSTDAVVSDAPIVDDAPPPEPTQLPAKPPFAVKLEGEQFSDYLARATAYNNDPAPGQAPVYDIVDWSELPVSP